MQPRVLPDADQGAFTSSIFFRSRECCELQGESPIEAGGAQKQRV